MSDFATVRAALIERYGDPTGGGASQGEQACWWQRDGHTLSLMGYCGADDAFLILDSRWPWWIAGPVPDGEALTPMADALDAADARLRELGVSFAAGSP